MGLHDSFFDLGGHSLLLVQVQSKLKDELGWDISLLDMFKYPTISLLVAHFMSESSEPISFQKSRDRAETRVESMNRQRQLRQKHRATIRQELIPA